MGRIVELRWTCGECDSTGILGRLKECPSCGAPREKGEMDMSGSGRRDADGNHPGATVTDPELLDLARAGPDWFCAYCESGNRGDVDLCESCSAPRLGEADEDHPDFAAAPPPPPPPPPAKKPRAKKPTTKSKGRGCTQCGCVVVGLFVLAILVGTLLSPDPPGPRVVRGEVTGVVWSQSLAQERWSDVTVRRFREDTREVAALAPTGRGGGTGGQPGLALLGNCRQEVKSHTERPCGSEEECTPRYRTETVDDTCTRTVQVACGETCTDLGNGFATCETDYCAETETYPCTDTRRVRDGEDCRTVTKYCRDPVYGTRCDYRTQEWQRLGGARERGTGVDTRWPTLDIRPSDRLAYSTDYDVTVTYRDGDDTRTLVLEEPVGPDLSGVDRATAEAARERLRAWAPGTPVWVSLRGWREVTGTSLEPPS